MPSAEKLKIGGVICATGLQIDYVVNICALVCASEPRVGGGGVIDVLTQSQRSVDDQGAEGWPIGGVFPPGGGIPAVSHLGGGPLFVDCLGVEPWESNQENSRAVSALRALSLCLETLFLSAA